MVGRAHTDVSRRQSSTLAVHNEVRLSLKEAPNNGDGEGCHIFVALQRRTTRRSGQCDTDGGGLDLWVSTRTSQEDPWSIPVNLNEDNVAKGGESLVNTAANEGAPALSWDGQTLFFYSNRAGGKGANDLYMSTRAREKP